MSVSNTTSKIQYAGNGSTTLFAIPFTLLADQNAGFEVNQNYITVWLNGVILSTANYTVNGPYASVNPNTVSFVVAPLAGVVITIARILPETQVSTWPNNVPFSGSAFQIALDRLTMQVQQLQEAQNRSLSLNIYSDFFGFDTTIPALPDPVDGFVLSAKTDGSGFVWIPQSSFVIVTSSAYPTTPPSTPPGGGSWAVGNIAVNTVPVAGTWFGWIWTNLGWSLWGPIAI